MIRYPYLVHPTPLTTYTYLIRLFLLLFLFLVLSFTLSLFLSLSELSHSTGRIGSRGWFFEIYTYV